ncbi:MAG: class I SAM-dependent methyltransferase, partial [Gammaproteobacteria bacterium]
MRRRQGYPYFRGVDDMAGEPGHGDSSGVPAHELPYFDEIFARQQADDPTFKEAFARNVHFGYWPQPASASGSLTDYAAATEELSRQIFRVAGVADSQALIDIGCGFGGTVAKLDAEYQGMRLVGLNIDPRQIAAARELCPTARPGNEIRFVVA